MTDPQQAEALKPCPFCQASTARMYPPTCDKLTPYNPADRAFPVVRCRCGAEKSGDNWDQSGKSAIAAWNRRSAGEEVVPMSEEQIAATMRPLYATDIAAGMGLQMDIQTTRAIEKFHGISPKERK